MKQTQEKLLSPSEVLQILNIPRHRLNYLFDTRKLKSEEFITLPSLRIKISVNFFGGKNNEQKISE